MEFDMGTIRLLIVSLVLAITCLTMASAEMEISDEYPGNGFQGDGVLHLAPAQVSAAVKVYQKVFGVLPQSWQQVKDSGTYELPLVDFQMHAFDPDGDAPISQGACRYSTGVDPDGVAYYIITTLDLDGVPSDLKVRDEDPYSYDDMLNFIKGQADMSSADLTAIDNWLASDAQKLQFGQLSLLGGSLRFYHDIHGEYPADIPALIDAGFGPFTHDSINPLTGELYKFDGSIGDIRYMLTPEGHVSISHVWQEGPQNFGFSY
jgi:hypothetical protein